MAVSSHSPDRELCPQPGRLSAPARVVFRQDGRMATSRKAKASSGALSAMEREEGMKRLGALLERLDEVDGPLPDDPAEDARIAQLLGADHGRGAQPGIPAGILGGMATTTIKVDTRLRDRIVEISRDFGASSLAETIERLIDEHEAQAAVAAYDALRADPEEWADYRSELAEWDSVTADAHRAAE
jgi:hypothetical protein